MYKSPECSCGSSCKGVWNLRKQCWSVGGLVERADTQNPAGRLGMCDIRTPTMCLSPRPRTPQCVSWALNHVSRV